MNNKKDTEVGEVLRSNVAVGVLMTTILLILTLMCTTEKYDSDTKFFQAVIASGLTAIEGLRTYWAIKELIKYERTRKLNR